MRKHKSRIDSVTPRLKVILRQMRGPVLREHESERQAESERDRMREKNSPHACWEIQHSYFLAGQPMSMLHKPAFYPKAVFSPRLAYFPMGAWCFENTSSVTRRWTFISRCERSEFFIGHQKLKNVQLWGKRSKCVRLCPTNHFPINYTPCLKGCPHNETAIHDVIRAPPSEITDVITTALPLLHFPHYLS